MDVIRHEGEMVDPQLVLLGIGGQELKMTLIVGIVVEHGLAIVAAGQDVVGTSVNYVTACPWHHSPASKIETSPFWKVRLETWK